MTHTSKLSWWKTFYSAFLPLQAEISIVYDRFLLKLYDTIWDVCQKLRRINPRFVMTCDYCGKAKLKVVEDIWGSIARKDVNHCKNIQQTRTNPYVTQYLRSRQVRICHDCIESMKQIQNYFSSLKIIYLCITGLTTHVVYPDNISLNRIEAFILL